jgi:glycosyltransferase involved in cell wall biosynthesis
MLRKKEQAEIGRGITVYQIVSTYYPSIGGVQRATGTLNQGLIQRGCDSQVLTTWLPGLRRYEIVQTTPVRRLGVGGPGKLRSLTFGLHTLYWVLRHGRSVPLIHTQNMDTPLLIGMLLSLLARKRWVATIHGEWHIPMTRRILLGQVRLYLMRRLVDHFIAISEGNRQVMLDEGIPPDRISLIPNSIDTDFFRPPQPEERRALRAQHGYQSGDVIVLFLGRLAFRKRPDLLLHAVAGLEQESRAKCIIVGDGPETDNLRMLTEKLALDTRVRFEGAVDNVRDFYWLSDIFVLPSQFEGFPVALLESMACGMAVLVTKCAGNLALVTDGVNGLTSEVDDVENLSQQLRILVNDANKRRALGKQAQRTILATCSMQVVSGAHLHIYREILNCSDGVREPRARRGRVK